MKTRLFLLIILFITSMTTIGQTSSIVLTFKAVDSIAYTRLDSIKVINRNQGSDTLLYWPDTVLAINNVGIHEISGKENTFQVFQNYPNPVTDQTSISLFVPEKDKVSLILTDVLGRIILKTERTLDQGIHTFRFTPGSENLYFFTAQWRSNRSSVKILKAFPWANLTVSLEYRGSEEASVQLKGVEDIRCFTFSFGDELIYVGYSNEVESGRSDKPTESKVVTFQFASQIPCLGTPEVFYEGSHYNTVQIFSQCWLKENLNAGTMIVGNEKMTDNGILEKYCYNNDTYNCFHFGGLYQWGEMMQYDEYQGAQGICPPEWHLPADVEWKLLEGATDSKYRIGDPEWDDYSYRGYDAGINLKANYGWENEGNGTNLYGFSGFPGGSRTNNGSFEDLGSQGYWMTSTEFSGGDVWFHGLSGNESSAVMDYINKDAASSVRCVRNDVYTESVVLKFTAVNNGSYVQLDRIRVRNMTQGGVVNLEWPDTTLVLEYELPYTPGDELLYIGYTDIMESAIVESLKISDIITFQFATKIPCPETPTVVYEGQAYNTIQIFSQCWLKDNLNVGTMVPGDQDMSDNGIIEKYCYGNDPANCQIYGALYQWDETMQYTEASGVQGICPPDWHIPTDIDWMIVSGATDSVYKIGDLIWMSLGPKGYDVGRVLKSTDGWNNGGVGTDLYEFTALPGGYRCSYLKYCVFNGDFGYWWTSQGYGYYESLWRKLSFEDSMIARGSSPRGDGLSVRCIRDF